MELSTGASARETCSTNRSPLRGLRVVELGTLRSPGVVRLSSSNWSPEPTSSSRTSRPGAMERKFGLGYVSFGDQSGADLSGEYRFAAVGTVLLSSRLVRRPCAGG